MKKSWKFWIKLSWLGTISIQIILLKNSLIHLPVEFNDFSAGKCDIDLFQKEFPKIDDVRNSHFTVLRLKVLILDWDQA